MNTNTALEKAIKEKMTYESPHLEIVEVQIEKGYAASGGTEDITNRPGVWD